MGKPETSPLRNNPEERSSQEFRLSEIAESIHKYVMVYSIHNEGPTTLLITRRSGDI